jgi:hypothetical protein
LLQNHIEGLLERRGGVFFCIFLAFYKVKVGVELLYKPKLGIKKSQKCMHPNCNNYSVQYSLQAVERLAFVKLSRQLSLHVSARASTLDAKSVKRERVGNVHQSHASSGEQRQAAGSTL